MRRDRLRAIARSRRREGATVTAIAAELGAPRSTVGDWVKGIEAEYLVTCGLCGTSFMAPVAKSKRLKFCSRTHQMKASTMRQAA